jgi:hypothetical protein
MLLPLSSATLLPLPLAAGLPGVQVAMSIYTGKLSQGDGDNVVVAVKQRMRWANAQRATALPGCLVISWRAAPPPAARQRCTRSPFCLQPCPSELVLPHGSKHFCCAHLALLGNRAALGPETEHAIRFAGSNQQPTAPGVAAAAHTPGSEASKQQVHGMHHWPALWQLARFWEPPANARVQQTRRQVMAAHNPVRCSSQLTAHLAGWQAAHCTLVAQ